MDGALVCCSSWRLAASTRVKYSCKTEGLTPGAEPEAPPRVALLSNFPCVFVNYACLNEELFAHGPLSGCICVKAEANVQAVFRGRVLGLQRVHVQEQRRGVQVPHV